MKAHRDIVDRLDDFLAGELEPSERRDLERHLESCSACADELVGLRSLLEQTRRLARSIEPERDLWPELRARIRAVEAGATEGVARKPSDRTVASRSLHVPEGTGFSNLWNAFRVRWVWAGAVGVAAIVTIALWPRGPEDPTSGQELATLDAESGGFATGATGSSDPDRIEGAASGRTSEPNATRFVSSLVCALESQCVGAGKELLASSTEVDGPLGAEMAATLESDVRLLDGAIAETLSALQAAPESPELLQMLTSRYQQKLALLHQAIRLVGEA